MELAVVNKAKTYLIVDKFTANMTSKVLDAFAEAETILDFIIGRYTSKLQVLGVGINKSFKYNLRECFESFIVRSETLKVHRVDVSHWVSIAWQNISSKMINNTWHRIGFGGEFPLTFPEMESSVKTLEMDMRITYDDSFFLPNLEEPGMENDADQVLAGNNLSSITQKSEAYMTLNSILN